MSGQRCPASMGKEMLRCCRLVEHDTTGPDAAGHHWHSTLMGPMAGPHEQHWRAGNGHPLVCSAGLALDVAPA